MHRHHPEEWGAETLLQESILSSTNAMNGAGDNILQNQAGSLGRRMMLGTYESEKVLCTYIPDNVPKAIAWGNYESNPDMYFYLAEFHEMIEEVPDPIQFVDIVAKLHRDSLGRSPDGKFGFHVPTHLANIPNKPGWKDTWEETYAEALKTMMEFEALSQGTDDDEFEELKKQTLSVVVPRLLRPLETGGRKVTPCLIHTDLWPGNCMPDADTDNIIFFDSCAMWGHNEADLGSWRAPRYRMGKPFIREYQRRVGMDFPADDWDDRNQLYAM
jgi:protein-ribulosamine 3-kinase